MTMLKIQTGPGGAFTYLFNLHKVEIVDRWTVRKPHSPLAVYGKSGECFHEIHPAIKALINSPDYTPDQFILGPFQENETAILIRVTPSTLNTSVVHAVVQKAYLMSTENGCNIDTIK